MKRAIYLDTLELSLDAYPEELLRKRLAADGQTRLDLHSYSRILTVVACLIHGGRRLHLVPLWVQMMTDCCTEIITIEKDYPADFAIKEIMFAYYMMLETGRLQEEHVQRWDSLLREMSPSQHYKSVARNQASVDKLHNINIYNMVGEFLREKRGLTDVASYFDQHWPIQLGRFDEATGMYKDPGCPMLYDLTTRCHIQLMLGLGYEGKYAEQLDGYLQKGGLTTLYTQSAAYEFAYGGRSNQFLFNEALIAVNAEFEAVRYDRLHNRALAGAFKRSAHLAVSSITRWLTQEPPRHIKNMYPVASKHGTEEYGYYDKYMITMGAFLAIAYWFADDAIQEATCPAEAGGYVWQAPACFHQIFANAGGYSLQIDTSANANYDATGLGRFHKRGAPTELALSTPLTSGNHYVIRPGLERIAGAIGPGWRSVGESIQYLAACSNLNHDLTILHESVDHVHFNVTYTGEGLIGCVAVVETYELDASGLRLGFELLGSKHDEIHIRIPLLSDNGEERTTIEENEGVIRVALGEYTYLVNTSADSEIAISDTCYGNRNGAYRMASLSCSGTKAQIHLAIIPVHKNE